MNNLVIPWLSQSLLNPLSDGGQRHTAHLISGDSATVSPFFLSFVLTSVTDDNTFCTANHRPSRCSLERHLCMQS